MTFSQKNLGWPIHHHDFILKIITMLILDGQVKTQTRNNFLLCYVNKWAQKHYSDFSDKPIQES